jgi:hypothetical protein
MTSYSDYVEHLKRLAHPQPVLGHIPVSYAAMLGRPIEAVTQQDDVLSIRFVGGGALRIWDDGQSCCENRYMTTDDELDTFVGAKVVNLEEVAGPDQEGSYGDSHEQMFVKLQTTAGTITMVTHNEHNGYYGGFYVATRWED